MMDITLIDIHELLPQQEPFVMVDSLVSFDMHRIVTATTVSDANIFVDAGVFTSAGLIENMAQTCAARIGYINKYILRKSISVGFIGAIRNLRIYRLPAIGETIETTVDTLEEVFGLTLVRATIRVGTEVIAEGEMKIAENREPLSCMSRDMAKGR